MFVCRKDSLKNCFHEDDSSTNHSVRLIEHIKAVHNLGDLPITAQCIEAVLYLINKGDKWRPRNSAKDDLKDLLSPHIHEYAKLHKPTTQMYSHCIILINYLVTEIVTNILVSVSEHFMKMLYPFINFNYKKNGKEMADGGVRRRVKAFKQLIDGNPIDDIETWEDDLHVRLQAIMPASSAFSGRSSGQATSISGQSSALPEMATAIYAASTKMKVSNLFRFYVHRKPFMQSSVKRYSRILCQNILRVPAPTLSLEEKQKIWNQVFDMENSVFRNSILIS